MRRSAVLDIVISLTAPLRRWRDRGMRREALALYGDHGRNAVTLLRERIAAASRYDDRRRLYRLHDEIARRLSSEGSTSNT